MVAEVRMSDGGFVELNAYGFPEWLVDASKRHHGALYMASRNLSPEDLFGMIALGLRLTYVLSGQGLAGVARLPRGCIGQHWNT